MAIKINKKIIFSSIIILVLVAGGFFWWTNREIKGSPEDYVIKETAEGKIVENKKAGLTVKVPEGWEVQKIEVMEGSVILYTSDIESMRPNKKTSPPLKKGCMIEVAVGYKNMSLDEIRKKIEEGHKSLGMKSDKFETVRVDNFPALKNIFNCVELGPSISAYLSIKDKLYQLSIIAGPEDIEKCSQEFGQFLETVSIKP